MKATALLYQLPKEKEQTIKEALNTLGADAKVVLDTDVYQTVGYLAGLEGYAAKEAVQATPLAEQPEVLVMCEFSQIQFDLLMQLFHHKKIPQIALKAVLTPTNREWTFSRLVSDLKIEHMLAMKQKKARKK